MPLRNKTLGAFVCIRTNNERLPGKNFLNIAGKPMYYWIFKSLLEVKYIDQIFLYSSSIKEYDKLPSEVEWVKREKYFDKNVSCSSLLKSFCEKKYFDYYLLAHATSPFTNSKSISKMIEEFNNNLSYDSAFTCSKIKSFLWHKGKPVNFDPKNIQRTQDMEPYFLENVGGYIFSNDQIIKSSKRVGENPLMWEVPIHESIDIDNIEDYNFAKELEDLINKN